MNYFFSLTLIRSFTTACQRKPIQSSVFNVMKKSNVTFHKVQRKIYIFKKIRLTNSDSQIRCKVSVRHFIGLSFIPADITDQSF